VTLPRQTVVSGLVEELVGFDGLIRPLTAEEWSTPTRCSGWKVADVAAHVVGTAADISAGRADLLTEPDRPDRQARERAGRSPEELADELVAAGKVLTDIAAGLDDAAWAGPPPVEVPGTLGMAVEGIWYDTYVHADDIRDALGRPSEHGPGLRAAVSHVVELLADRDWGPATLRLDGMDPVAVGGGGPEVRGDPLMFVLVATGRAHPIELGLDQTVNLYA
jgi:uncharacterized protein (TIGR03083 family)